MSIILTCSLPKPWQVPDPKIVMIIVRDNIYISQSTQYDHHQIVLVPSVIGHSSGHDSCQIVLLEL